MPQAFSAPSVEAYKEARAQAVPDATSMGPAAPLGSKEPTQPPSAGLPGAHCRAHAALGLPMADVGATGQARKDG